jgi:hypothetical protein
MSRFTRPSTLIGTSAGVLLTLAACGERSETPAGPTAPRTPLSHYAAPAGSKTADGSKDQPWDVGTALAGGHPAGAVQPGDTIWLRGGTYRGHFRSTVSGRNGAPVVVRQHPGERAIVDGAGTPLGRSVLDVRGPWSVFWGFEITNSDPNRITTDSAVPHDWRPNVVANYASHTRYINLVVHDGGVAFYNESDYADVEIAGCLIYNNGWQGPVFGDGHALYLRSAVGPVIARDNIMFNQFGYGLHAYTDSAVGGLVGITLDGNVSFNNGSVTLQYAASSNANLLIGGGQPVAASTVRNNMTYFSPGIGVKNVVLGFKRFPNSDLTFENNYMVGGNWVLTVGAWSRLSVTGNTLAGPRGMTRLETSDLSGFTWEGNTYWRSPESRAWQYGDSGYGFAAWKEATRVTATDVASSETPSLPQVFVRVSPWEAGRANVIVYNWGRTGSVLANLGGALKVGDRFEVRNVQDFFGAPVSSGTYSGGAISIPMGGVAPPAMIGGAPHAPPQTGPDFDVFVVLKTVS